MAGFLNDSALLGLTGAMFRHYETFRKPVTIYKLPLKITNSGPSLMGYNNDESNLETTQEYATFSGVRFYPKPKFQQEDNLKTPFDKTHTYLKVQKDAADYIINGANEKIVIDGVAYDQPPNTNYRVQDYFGLIFYVFDLDRLQ